MTQEVEVELGGRSQKRKRKDKTTITEGMVKYHHYPTPSQFVRHAIRYFMSEWPLFFQRAMWEHNLRILDHSCGTGVWNAVGMELIPTSHRVNVEYQIATPIRPETAHEWYFGQRFQDYAAQYAKLHRADSRAHPLYDVVWGNFPFKEGEEFIHSAGEIMRMNGYMFNLAPINFLSTQDRTKSLYREWRPIRVIHIPKRISFTKDGGTDEKEYVIIVHQKGVNPRFAQEDWWFDWDMDAPDLPEDAVFNGVGAPTDQESFLDLWQGVTA